MTADRKKAAFFLVLTLIVGILIGMMIPGFLFRMHRGGPPKAQKEMRGGRGGRPDGPGPGRQDTVRREWLTRVIIRVVKPDSAQMKAIRPLTTATAVQVKALEGESNERMGVIMDSLKLKLRPILSEEQNRKLEDFSSKARKRWRR